MIYLDPCLGGLLASWHQSGQHDHAGKVRKAWKTRVREVSRAKHSETSVSGAFSLWWEDHTNPASSHLVEPLTCWSCNLCPGLGNKRVERGLNHRRTEGQRLKGNIMSELLKTFPPLFSGPTQRSQSSNTHLDHQTHQPKQCHDGDAMVPVSPLAYQNSKAGSGGGVVFSWLDRAAPRDEWLRRRAATSWQMGRMERDIRSCEGRLHPIQYPTVVEKFLMQQQ